MRTELSDSKHDRGHDDPRTTHRRFGYEIVSAGIKTQAFSRVPLV